MTTFEELIAGAKRPTDSVQLCLRGDLTGPYRELERQLRTASRTAPSLAERSPAALIAEQMRAIEVQMAAAEKRFDLEAMLPKDWSDFYGTQPEKKKDEADEAFKGRWFVWVCNLVSRSVVAPVVMTPEQVAQLCDVLSARQWDQLTDSAYGLNANEVAVPFSVAVSALIPAAEQS